VGKNSRAKSDVLIEIALAEAIVAQFEFRWFNIG
jgi:hypothetical protein